MMTTKPTSDILTDMFREAKGKVKDLEMENETLKSRNEQLVLKVKKLVHLVEGLQMIKSDLEKANSVWRTVQEQYGIRLGFDQQEIVNKAERSIEEFHAKYEGEMNYIIESSNAHDGSIIVHEDDSMVDNEIANALINVETTIECDKNDDNCMTVALCAPTQPHHPPPPNHHPNPSQMQVVKAQKNPFICQYNGCGKLFSNEQNYQDHYTTIHLGEKRRYVCGWQGCQFRASYKSNVYQHRSKVHKKKAGTFYIVKGGKNQQIEVSNLLVNADNRGNQFLKVNGKYICTYPNCGKKFTYENSWKEHYQGIHLGDKPFKCEQPNCTYKSCYRSNLYIHRKNCHTNK